MFLLVLVDLQRSTGLLRLAGQPEDVLFARIYESLFANNARDFNREKHSVASAGRGGNLLGMPVCSHHVLSSACGSETGETHGRSGLGEGAGNGDAGCAVDMCQGVVADSSDGARRGVRGCVWHRRGVWPTELLVRCRVDLVRVCHSVLTCCQDTWRRLKTQGRMSAEEGRLPKVSLFAVSSACVLPLFDRSTGPACAQA